MIALTDVSGAPFASHRYDPWGVITSSLTTATASMDASLAARIAERQPLRYAGYVHDAESRMYYCSARTYDPTTRQFLSKDPAKDDGEESAYQYCGGDPVGKVDPSGLSARPAEIYPQAATYGRRFVWACETHLLGVWFSRRPSYLSFMVQKASTVKNLYGGPATLPVWASKLIMPTKAAIAVRMKYRHMYAWRRYVHLDGRVIRADVQIRSWTKWKTRTYTVSVYITRNEWVTERLTASTRVSAWLQARRRHDQVPLVGKECSDVMWFVYPLTVIAVQYTWGQALIMLNMTLGGFSDWLYILVPAPLWFIAGYIGMQMERVISGRSLRPRSLLAPTAWSAVFVLDTMASAIRPPPVSVWDVPTFLQSPGAVALCLYLGMLVYRSRVRGEKGPASM